MEQSGTIHSDLHRSQEGHTTTSGSSCVPCFYFVSLRCLLCNCWYSLTETRPRCLGCPVCQLFPGCPEHPLLSAAVLVHADVWSSHQRKHSHQTHVTRVSRIKYMFVCLYAFLECSKNNPVAFKTFWKIAHAGPSLQLKVIGHISSSWLSKHVYG